MDMLVEQTHEVRHEWRNNERPMRYTDTRLDEQHRAVSLKMVPMSLLLESSTGKSFLMNLIDAPGELPVVPACQAGLRCSCTVARVHYSSRCIVALKARQGAALLLGVTAGDKLDQTQWQVAFTHEISSSAGGSQAVRAPHCASRQGT